MLCFFVVAVSTALLLSGCPELDNPAMPSPRPPYELFVSTVQPVLARDCASNGCHGTRVRALTLYAVGGLRAPPAFPSEPLPETRLTEAELTWNYDALCLRLIDEVDAEVPTLLRKQLPVGGGGIGHAGGKVVYESRRAPGYRALAAWIAEAK